MDQQESDVVEVAFGFRKFIMMLLLFLVAIVFTLKGYISGSNFVDLMKGTMISFFAANGFEHASLTVRQYLKSNSNNQPTSTPGGEDGKQA